MNYIDEVKINLFISTLKKCTKGSIMITDPSGEIVKINNNSEVTADIKINDWSIINNLIKIMQSSPKDTNKISKTITKPTEAAK